MQSSTKTGMLASRTPERWGKRMRRQDKPTGGYRKLQTRARRRAERNAWRADTQS